MFDRIRHFSSNRSQLVAIERSSNPIENYCEKRKFNKALSKWILSSNSQEEKDKRIAASLKIKTYYEDLRDKKCVSIDLRGMNLSELPSKAFTFLKYKSNVDSIFVCENQFTEIPKMISNFSNINCLNLSNNNITELPPEIGLLQNLTCLYLSDNFLTSLPKEFGLLIKLEHVSIINNKLRTLPNEIGKLTHLKTLHAQKNNIQSLPKEIGSLPLESLDLYENELEELPVEITNLVKLIQLDISRNNLRRLPNEIGYLTNLKKIDFSENPRLGHLPMSLGNCSKLFYFDINGTNIPYVQKNAILSRCEHNRAVKGEIELFPRLETWKAYSQKDINLTFVKGNDTFSSEEKKLINEWLLRLETTNDFSNEKKEIAQIVCKMVMELKANEEFRQSFFLELRENLSDCGDRAAMLLNILYTNFELSHICDGSMEKKMEILAGSAKTITLRDAIQRKLNNIVSREESAEIFLFYETKFKKSLGLSTVIKTMLFERIGCRFTETEEMDLINAVQSNYLYTMLNFTILDTILDQNQEYCKEKTAIVKESQDKLSLLVHEGEDEISEGDYLKAVDAIKKDNENALFNLKKQYVEKFLPVKNRS